MNTNGSTSEGEDSNGREVMDILRENLNTVVIAGIYGILMVSWHLWAIFDSNLYRLLL